MKFKLRLRECEKESEILKNLSEANYNHSHVTIWQNNEFGRRIVSGSIAKVDLLKKSLLLNISTPIHFNDTETSFIHITFKNILFKLNAHIKGKDLVTINIPDMIKLQENRILTRQKLENTNTTLTLEKFSAFKSSQFQFKAQIIDYSCNGLGLKIKTPHISRFNRGEELLVQAVQNKSLNSPIKTHIAYIRQLGDGFQVGLRFDQTQQNVNEWF